MFFALVFLSLNVSPPSSIMRVKWVPNSSGVISFCYFFSIYSNEAGGAVNANAIGNLVVDDSSFVNCSSFGFGGGIYSNVDVLSLERSCFLRCFSTGIDSYGSGVYATSLGSKNFSFMAMSRCSNACGSLMLDIGHQYTSKCNFSSSFDSFSTGQYTNTPLSLTLEYSTVSQTSGITSIGFYTFSLATNMHHVNIVDNQLSKGYVYTNNAVYTLNYFVFIKNTGLMTFWYHNKGSVTFSNCVFDTVVSPGECVYATPGCVFACNVCTMHTHSFFYSDICYDPLITLNKKPFYRPIIFALLMI